MWRIWRIVDYFIGHKWGRWGKFGYKDFLTVSDKNRRECNRCYKREYRPWNKRERMALAKTNKKITKLMSKNNEVGQLYGVRFISTSES